MLYIVATPIGNLEDMSYRSVKTLHEVDYVFAEDTRVTKKLLDHYEIQKVIYRYDEYTKGHQVANIIKLLKEGAKIALVTDAGTPCISDPGYEVVEAAHRAGEKVVSIPGPSSMVAAASISGLDMRRIVFEGFLPKKKGRQTLLKKLAEEERTIIFFESPHRIAKTIGELGEYLGEEREIVIVRELTKIYEEVIRGQAKELAKRLQENPIKGEIVVLVKAKEKVKKEKKSKYSPDE